MHEGTELGGRDRLVEIRVRKHDHRRLASELEQHALEMACRVFRHQAADARRAREVDAADRGMRDQLIDHIGGVGGVMAEEIDDPGRQAGIVERAGDRRVRAGTHLRALQDHGVTEGERRGNGAGAEDQRRDNREQGEIKSVNDRFQEALVGDELCVVVEPYVMRRRADRPVERAHPDGEQPGENDDGAYDDQRRDYEKIITAAPAGEEA